LLPKVPLLQRLSHRRIGAIPADDDSKTDSDLRSDSYKSFESARSCEWLEADGRKHHTSLYKSWTARLNLTRKVSAWHRSAPLWSPTHNQRIWHCTRSRWSWRSSRKICVWRRSALHVRPSRSSTHNHNIPALYQEPMELETISK